MKEDVEETSPSYLEETNAEVTLSRVQKMGSVEHNILGVLWEQGTDQLIFDVADVAWFATTLEPTRRNIVSTTGRFYDPLELLVPLIVKFKILFQK